MKILKKEKQMSASTVLKHTPSTVASAVIDQNAQSLFTRKQSDLHDQVRATELSSYFTSSTRHDCTGEQMESVNLNLTKPANGVEDDGGGCRVKKKRKKKERNEPGSAANGATIKEIKPKKKREPKESKEPRRPKEPKKSKELKQQKDPKKPRKPREAKLSKEKSMTGLNQKHKSRKNSKEQGPTPVEKKKKGKRKNENSLDNLESDEGLSLTTNIPSTEDTNDSVDGQRRSGRQVKRRKYNEDLDFKVVDDDGETIAVLGTGRLPALSTSTLAWQAEEPPEDEANIIEKILSVRIVKKETSPIELLNETEEFYVKYRNFSYLHCKWATLQELEKDPRIHQKIKRFRNKQAQMKHIFTEPDEDLFNPDYIEVDRVLEVAHTKDTETGEEVTHYLVKWCSLSYEESTWELQEDVDPGKIKEFEDIKKIPENKHADRPASDAWQKLEKSRDYKNGNELREYQLEGMNWLLFNWYNRKNCILADEMGLGKTIQSITFLFEIFLMGLRGPFLIIAPLSTITNWEREFRTWTDMNVIVYHGSQISRQMIQQYEMFYKDEQGLTLPGIFKFHAIITTFEMILADCPELKKIQWRCVVIDEAHRLKNRNCKLLEGLKLMNLEHKVLLTGTPLQNSVEELFSLLNFLEPNQFSSENTFLEEFGDLKTEEQVKKLQAILKPMMLRRLKDDVEKNLAPKEETIIEVELTNIQKKYYRAILEKNFTFLAKGANQHNMPNLINTMMELRKCCNHPYLITGAEEKILEDFRKKHNPEAWDFQLQAMIQAAGKLVLIDKLLPKLIAGGHKVLVFSQMVRCLDILEDYLIQRRYTYERIDGRVRGNLRQAAIDRFCKADSDRFVFLLCTRAGGLGINLTAADTCIIFDSDWNPQNDLQAQARCHRIGQSKAVKVYRLITRNSYEREMFDKASLKLGLDKAVLQDINRKGSTNGVQQLSKKEVEDLLRKGAYGALMDEEDEGSKFCEEDIDQILQRRTQTITIQSEGKGSTFAKASFVSSGNRTDISLDDPNFWQKWAKIAELEIESIDEKESLVIDTPRVRKQTRHYNSFEDDELMEFSELDSDSEDRPCRTRRLNERNRRYMRAECFRVEKNLLIFGWGRWKDILTHGRFKWHLAEKDMEVICRALLVYCVKHYKGDEKIRSFIWDLITPTKDGQNQALQNHSGLSAPVPRGRKGKKMKNQMSLPEIKNADWLANCNPETVLCDDSYKKHLKQHCNKVLLRVRMLYYLKSEILGEAADKALEDISASKLDVVLPDIDYMEIPAHWWDAGADKSLLIGVHKHGYERYNAMRADTKLCFLEKVGMPDEKALSAEQGGSEGVADMEREPCKEEDLESKPDIGCEKGIKEEDTSVFSESSDKANCVSTALEISDQDRLIWPAGSALTARLRRLITAYQRFNRKEIIRPEFLVPDSHGCWHLAEEIRRRVVEPDSLFMEIQNRWTRREQADFYRTVSSFGVIYDPDKKTFDWKQFRSFARLERKTDQSLERYFHSFVAMCRNSCHLPSKKEEGSLDQTVFVEPITEERAARTLYRIELLRKVREQVLRHPQLGERLKLCQPSLYLPVWWECGKHDRDLLLGVARHGLSRTDYYILNDPQLSFLEAHRNYVQKENKCQSGATTHCCLYKASISQQGSLVDYPCGHTLMEPTGVIDDPLLDVVHTHKDPYMECSSIDDSMDLVSLHPDESLGAVDTLHNKSAKGATNGFPFKTDTGGQNMLNTYSVQNDVQGEMESVESKLQASADSSDPAHCDSDLMGASEDLDEFQSQWESGQHSSGTDMFNESDAILSGQTLESEFLDSTHQDESRVDSSLADCMMIPNLGSQSSAVDNLQTSFMLFKDLASSDQNGVLNDDHCVSGCLPHGVADTELHNDSASSPQENAGDSGEKMSDSDVTHSVPSPCDGPERVNLDFEKEDISQDDRSNAEVTEECIQQTEYCTCDVSSNRTHQSLKNEPLLLPPALLDGEADSDSKDNIAEEKVPYLEAGMQKEKLVHLSPKQENPEEIDGVLKEVKEAKGQTKGEENCEEEKYGSRCVQSSAAQEIREPTIAQLLQEKALYSFSEWPKDRVIINRIDNICQAILKGKWPSSSQQFDSPTFVSTPSLQNNIAQRNTFLPSRMPSSTNLSFNIGASVSHLAKDGLMGIPYLRDVKQAKRGFEFEPEVTSKLGRIEKIPIAITHANAPLVLNGWQETAIDLSKAGDLNASPSQMHLGSGANKMGSISALQSTLGMDMAGILQAGLIHPVTGQIVNGNLRRDDAVMRRRRGRRKNVEGVDLQFSKSQNFQEQNGDGDQKQGTTGNVQPEKQNSTSHSPQAERSTVDRDVPNKSLLEWLRQNPNYSMEMHPFPHNVGILHGFAERPKQRRHRCKDPSKLDVKSLTGEERVPVVHKGTGRRLGGAMAPAMKELSRWLDANTDYAVAPDWAEIVRHSGFLPEGKFNRILTEPVSRDLGPRRRGRRPRSEIIKSAGIMADSSSTVGPLFMNGLISGMDLVSLQNLRNMQSIPLTGVMGFPHSFAAVSAGEDPKNSVNMLPMMLHSMATVQPHMFSVSGLLNPMVTTAATTVTPTVTSTSESTANSSDSSSTETALTDKERPEESKKEDKASEEISNSSGTISGTGNHPETTVTTTGTLAFNPFLIPGMSHGLLYPHMFLPHGISMALPGMQPASPSDGSNTESPKRKKRKVKDECGAEITASTGHKAESATSPQITLENQTEASTKSGESESSCGCEPERKQEEEGWDLHEGEVGNQIKGDVFH
ncbi:chromodomain-helicase-DNA-binding protein 6 isoform X2 [Erpetoichthys calabaricus]|uniref:chromodomain-helicase-DNA-binding protein 6 isoform X2 n=1 Tax=Erpetoichthys calabaricus TaxID=27687 RepID=UPI00109F9464|nr:chromodomain-helicase-DNA-binding protein 6 isoform X2 [Erpetoichthys calabaricus]